MRIYIYDPVQEKRENIRNLVQIWGRDQGGGFLIQDFAESERLLECIREPGALSLFLLEGSGEGVELARVIRRKSQDGFIIFLAGTPQYAFEAFGVHAFGYLLYPFERTELYSVLDDVLRIVRRQQENSILIRTSAGEYRVSPTDISYCELRQKRILYHFVDGKELSSTSIRNSFRESVGDLLAFDYFSLCGASFVINLEHVISVQEEEVLLLRNHRITIPRRNLPALRKNWHNHWKQELPDHSPTGDRTAP